MAATDHPLKRLVSLFIDEFAAWLLNSPVREARPLNVELPADLLTTDQVFRVTLVDGRELVLHIEFQGRRSHQLMPWRMLQRFPVACATATPRGAIQPSVYNLNVVHPTGNRYRALLA